VRATSLPTARSVAAAALALVAAVLAPLAAPSTALAERWLRPVPGELARPFAYDRAAPFTAGAHRGADLAARPGAPVRAACAGRVVHAGAVAGRDRVVSVRCATRRVSYLPLATIAVTEGARIRAGSPIGTIARGHGGLHLGVRAEGDPFGYEDPMALLRAPAEPFAPAPRPPTPRPAVHPGRPRAVPRPAPSRRPVAGRAPSSPAPWPVWLGLAALLAGAAGSGTIAVRRRSSAGHGADGAAASLRRPPWPSM
jgi:murein DD-endopeptidase MepM/ murein hydrolase activator NlpD